MPEENALSFAREELCRYAALMDPGYDAAQIQFTPFSRAELDELEILEPYWDDAYRIDVRDGRGQILYSNARSALLGVYRLLREAGCAFLRPGPEGEVVPRTSLASLCVQARMRAANRHRCICIEGSVSLENALDMVDFAPKAGYNAYFTQFMEAYTFFERWYTHKGNPLRAPEAFSPALSREMLACLVRAVKRRGLLYHAVGHGWTCEPLGIPGLHWEDDGVEPTPAQRACMAQVNGVRGLHNGIALNTNLCYSNPEVRSLMAHAIADYAARYPEVDVLHVWLADDYNNQCECDACRQARPADFYVQMLNEADALLTAQGSPVRIAFLLYFDLLFPPQTARLQNEGRFILMYAPITRSFSRSFEGVRPAQSIPEYARNRLSFGPDIAENLGYLAAWQRVFSGDSFDFDYHLCAAVTYDPGQMTLSRVLHGDVRALSGLGLHGLINCQQQRVTMPHGFALFLGGQALCDPSLDYERARDAYFECAFGPEYGAALCFCETLSRLFPMDLYGKDHPEPSEQAARALESLRAYLERVELPAPQDLCPAQARSWQNLRFWRAFMLRLCDYLIPFSRRDETCWRPAWEELRRFAWEREAQVQAQFDVYCFLEHYRRQQA